jgi:hypothetical protein
MPADGGGLGILQRGGYDMVVWTNVPATEKSEDSYVEITNLYYW